MTCVNTAAPVARAVSAACRSARPYANLRSSWFQFNVHKP